MSTIAAGSTTERILEFADELVKGREAGQNIIMKVTIILTTLFMSQALLAADFFNWREQDQVWAGFGVGFPIRYDANDQDSTDDLKGIARDFPYASTNYFFQYTPFEFWGVAYGGLELGGLISAIRRNDEQNENIYSLYGGLVLDVEELLEFKVGFHNSDFEVRQPRGDHGLYFGAGYNVWRGDGFRVQLDYRIFKGSRTDREAEFANLMFNLIVSARKFMN